MVCRKLHTMFKSSTAAQKISPKLSDLKQQAYYLSYYFLWVRNLEVAWLKGSCYRSLIWLQSSEGLIGTEGSVSQWLSHVAIGKKPHFLTM